MPASLSYSCDSPFFAKRSSHCDQDLEKLAEFLRTLTGQMKQFCREAQTLARTAEDIGIHMKSGLGATAGSSLLPVLACFGDIFTEIAGAQEILAESLDRSFTTPLDRFCNEEVLSVHQLRNQYLVQREQNESIISRYLQSDLANFGRGTTQSHLDMRAHEVVRQTKRFESVRYDLVRKINEMEARKSFEVAESCVAGILSLRTYHHTCMDRLLASNNFIEELRSQQQRDRAAFEVSMRPLDRKRHDISAVLDAMVERVEMASAFLQTDMSAGGTGAVGADTSVAGMLLDYAAGGASVASGASPDPTSSNAFSRLGAFMGGLTSSAKGGSQSTRKSITEDGASAPLMALCEECEARMKALDHSELVPFFNVRPDEEPAGAVKQGYLWRRVNRKVMDTWERRWFILDDSKMYYVSEADDTHRIHVVCELMLANIRELKNYEVPFCFEIAFANFKTTIVQAEGTKEYAAWIQALRSGIEKSLVSGRPSACPGNPPATSAPGGVADAMGPSYTMTTPAGASSASRRTLMRPVIDKILANSPVCAECARPGPEWVSLNIGCLVCIDCSGVHRSMGVHISKMRSLTLDDLEPAEYAMLLSMGNTMTNSIWEKELDARGAEKPTVQSHYMTRDVFIRAKYQYKAFLSNPPVCVVDPPNATLLPAPPNVVLWERDVATKALCEAVSSNDMYEVVRALAADADVSGGLSISAEEQLKDGVIAPLMIAIRRGSLEAAVLLVINGASLTQEASRSDSTTPLEAALTLAPKLSVNVDPVSLHELQGTEAICAYILNKAEQGARLGASYSPAVSRTGARKRVEETNSSVNNIQSKDDSAAEMPKKSSLGPGSLTMKAKQFITRSSSPHVHKPCSPVMDGPSTHDTSGPARYRGASDFGAMPPTSPGVRARSKSNGDEIEEAVDLTTGVSDNNVADKKAGLAPGSSKISQKMKNAFNSTDFLFPHESNGRSVMSPASEPHEVFHQPFIHKYSNAAVRSVPGRVSSPEDSLIRSIGTRPPPQKDSSHSSPTG